MHSRDFLIDVDVNAPGQVDSASTLSIGISDGQQVFPSGSNSQGANRLLIFGGTALNTGLVGHDSNLARGVLRVRLGFPLQPSIIFKSSATVAALSSLHGEGDEDDWTFAADAAITVTDPTDGNTISNPKGLPPNELYLVVDAAFQGDGTRLARVAYQANVLVQDTEPDLDSVLLSPAGQGTFVPQLPVSVTGGPGFVLFDLKVTLTGQAPLGDLIGIVLESDHLQDVPVAQLLVVNEGDFSALLQNNIIFNTAPDETVTITATNPKTNTMRTATLIISRPR